MDGEFKPLDAAQIDATVPLCLADDLRIGKAAQKATDRHLGLESGERRAQAVVRP